MSDIIARIETSFINDDWVYGYLFTDSSGTAVDKSASTFAASLVTQSPLTTTPISGANGSVDTSQAASGVVVVTVYDALTSTLTPDMDSVSIPISGQTSFNTRLVLTETIGATTETRCITPIRVVRR